MYFEKAEMKGQNQKNVLQMCRKSMPSCILTPKKYLFYSKNHEKCRIVIKLSGSSLKLALFATPAFLAQIGLHAILLPPTKSCFHWNSVHPCRVALLCSIQQIPGSHSCLFYHQLFSFPQVAEDSGTTSRAGLRRRWERLWWSHAQSTSGSSPLFSVRHLILLKCF